MTRKKISEEFGNPTESDLLGDFLDEDVCHDCSSDTQEKRSIRSEDKEEMVTLLMASTVKNKPISEKEARTMANRYM